MSKLLILSSDTGEGHNSAAAAIGAAAAASGLTPVIRKPLEESGAWNRVWASAYNGLLTHRPQSMKTYFDLIERFRPNERDVFYSKARGFIGEFIRSANPDVLLSVHPMLNHFIQRYIKEEDLKIPCYTFLTDPFPPFWRGWSSAHVDRYFVPTSEALQSLTAMGVPCWKIEHVPMPVRSQFQPMTPGERLSFHAEHQLEKPHTILINGGARGGGPILSIYRHIRMKLQEYNVLVICGRNVELEQNLLRLNDPHTRVFGYVKDIHRFVAASNLVMTKPGALSTFEALACGTPVLLLAVGGVMPQESGLFHAARHYDFGFVADTFEAVGDVVDQGPAQWNSLRSSIEQFYRANSGDELITRIRFHQHAAA